MTTKPRAYRTSAEFRAWLEKNHDRQSELMMRLFKVHARSRGIGYREALDEALCFGWIDGVRRALDEDSFTQRFTPRRARSVWSAVNTRRMNELIAEGRVAPPGLAAFQARDPSYKAQYSFEHAPKSFDPALEKRFRANRKAWTWWEQAAPYYRRVCTFYVMGAMKEETRARRLENLMRHCEQGRKMAPLDGAKKK
jgi:uncharacterized protein YdeI (YjbR/CyaY-like superfamily)